MEQQTVRKTYKYRLRPTRQQEWELERVLMLCRHVYNAAVGERQEAWRMRGVSVSYYQQKAELPGSKEAMPQSTARSTPRSCRTWWCAWIGRFRRSFSA
jgi:putative transposase